MTPEFEKELTGYKQRAMKAAELIPTIEESFAKIQQRNAENVARYQRDLARFVEDHGDSADCERHPGQQKLVNREKCTDIPSQKQADPQGFTVFWHPCPVCAAEIQFKRNAERWKPHGIPQIFLGAKLETLSYQTAEGQSNLATCENYAEKPEGVLILFGGVGTGKTHAACSILQRQPDGHFVTQSNLLSQHRKTYRDQTAPDIRDRCMRCGLLVIDEIGVSVGGGDEESLLMDVLGHRYNELLPTVLTSNLAEDDFKRRIGERLIDRFRQTLYASLHFTEKSRRAESNQRYFETLDLSKAA